MSYGETKSSFVRNLKDAGVLRCPNRPGLQFLSTWRRQWIVEGMAGTSKKEKSAATRIWGCGSIKSVKDDGIRMGWIR